MKALEKDYRLAHVSIGRDYSSPHSLVNDIV